MSNFIVKLTEEALGKATITAKKAINARHGRFATSVKLDYSVRKAFAEEGKDILTFYEKVGENQYIQHTAELINKNNKYTKFKAFADSYFGRLIRWIKGINFNEIDLTQFANGKLVRNAEGIYNIPKTSYIKNSKSAFSNVATHKAEQVKESLEEAKAKGIIESIKTSDITNTELVNVKKEGFDITNGRAVVKKDAIKLEGLADDVKQKTTILLEIMGEGGDGIRRTIMDKIGPQRYAEIVDQKVNDMVVGKKVKLTDETAKILDTDEKLKLAYTEKPTDNVIGYIHPEDRLKFDYEVNRELLTEYMEKDPSGEGLFNITKAAPVAPTPPAIST